jgi:hypothetical protein
MLVKDFKLVGDILVVETENEVLNVVSDHFVEFVKNGEYQGYYDRSMNPVNSNTRNPEEPLEYKFDKKHFFKKEIDKAIVSLYLNQYASNSIKTSSGTV